jgi:hypothetical protein
VRYYKLCVTQRQSDVRRDEAILAPERNAFFLHVFRHAKSQAAQLVRVEAATRDRPVLAYSVEKLGLGVAD